jgi:hypothetical protein
MKKLIDKHSAEMKKEMEAIVAKCEESKLELKKELQAEADRKLAQQRDQFKAEMETLKVQMEEVIARKVEELKKELQAGADRKIAQQSEESLCKVCGT